MNDSPSFLVIDDSSMQDWKLMLSPFFPGARFLEADDAQDAIEQYLERGIFPDYIFLDSTRLKEKDGLDISAGVNDATHGQHNRSVGCQRQAGRH